MANKRLSKKPLKENLEKEMPIGVSEKLQHISMDQKGYIHVEGCVHAQKKIWEDSDLLPLAELVPYKEEVKLRQIQKLPELEDRPQHTESMA